MCHGDQTFGFQWYMCNHVSGDQTTIQFGFQWSFGLCRVKVNVTSLTPRIICWMLQYRASRHHQSKWNEVNEATKLAMYGEDARPWILLFLGKSLAYQQTLLSVSKMESVSWGSWEVASSSSKSPLLLFSSWSPKPETLNPQTRNYDFWSDNETLLVFFAILVPESQQKMHTLNIFSPPHEGFFCITYPQQVLQQSQVCPQDLLCFCLSFTIWLDNWKVVHMCTESEKFAWFWKTFIECTTKSTTWLEAKIEFKIIWHNFTAHQIGLAELD